MTAGNNNKILFEGDNRRYIADFLQNGAKTVYINIHLPPSYRGSGSWAAEISFPLKSGKQMKAVKYLFGEIELNTFEPDLKTIQENTEFYLADSCPELGMYIKYTGKCYVLIYIKDSLKDSLDANLVVQYNNFTERKNKVHKCFTGLIADDTKNSLIEFANNMFYEYVQDGRTRN